MARKLVNDRVLIIRLPQSLLDAIREASGDEGASPWARRILIAAMGIQAKPERKANASQGHD
jgi:hypothetical protein